MPSLATRFSFRGLLWFGVLALGLHNAEEALTGPGWQATRLPQVEQQFGISLPVHPSPAQLYAGVSLATVIPALWVLACWRSPRKSLGLYSLMSLYAVLFLNALVPHIASAVLLRSYTPGVATAALINVPYVLHLFRRALGEGYVSRGGLGVAVVIGAALYGPAVWLLLGLAGQIVSAL